jgi:hypothetical protein
MLVVGERLNRRVDRRQPLLKIEFGAPRAGGPAPLGRERAKARRSRIPAGAMRDFASLT